MEARDEGAVRLFKRCVKCPSASPVCGSCPNGQICQLNSQTCDACASTTCVSASSVDSASPSVAPQPSSPAGPVAGGVIGGIILIAAIVFGVWWFCIRKRKQQHEQERASFADYNMGSEKDLDAQTMRRSQRASTHTVASYASTALTRASNIIPIAYIPGVTNRSLHSSPGIVPPVPPIPAASSPGGSPMIDGDESHYFMPRDLRDSIRDSMQSSVRDSAYEDHRRSVARTSIASTIYRSNAIVSPVPAQMGTRAKPMAVSVRSNGRSPVISRSGTPPVPSVPAQSSIIARVGVPKSVQIKKGSGLRSNIYELDGSASDSGSLAHKPSAELMSPSDVSESDDERAVHQRLVGHSFPQRTQTMQTVSEYDLHSPGARSDHSDTQLLSQTSPNSLNRIIEEAAMQASRDPVHTGASGTGTGLPSPGIVSPFGDEHAARTP